MAVLLRQPPSDLDRKHKVRVGVGVASGQVRGALHQEFEEIRGPNAGSVCNDGSRCINNSERLRDRRGSSGKPHGWADIIVVDQDDNPSRQIRLGGYFSDHKQ